MRTLLITIFSIILLNSFGQQKVFYGDSTQLYNWQRKKITKFGLQELLKSQHRLEIRISSLNTVTDIWTEDSSKFEGFLIFFASPSDEYLDDNNLSFIDELQYVKKPITEDIAKIIWKLVKEYNIQSLPPQDAIQGWEDGLDGSEYFIEFSTTKFCSFKQYWDPTSYPAIPAAVNLSQFINKIDDLLGLTGNLDSFIKTLPEEKRFEPDKVWNLKL